MNGDTRAAIELRDVRKSFGDVVALDGLDVSVPTGSICGFLGPNGAGKTTTIRLLLGMARADGGEVRVLSRDTAVEAASVAVRRRTGFVSEAKEFYPHMRVAELIRFTRGFYPGWRADRERELLREFELPAERGVQQLSKGMRSKLALLLACCRGAELLILDEPTDGLDPSATEQVLGMLVRLAAEDGATVFFSSHQLHEVERIADRIAIIHRGRVRLDGDLDDVRARFRRVRLVLDDEGGADALTDAPTVRSVARSGRVLSLLVDGDPDDVIERARLVTTLHSAEAQSVGLRELFLDLTGGRG